MSLQDLEKLITFYNNCTFLKETTKQVMIGNIWKNRF